MADEINKVTPEVGAETVAETTEEVAEEKGKTAFPIAEAMYRDAEGNIVTAVNADGLLIAVPKPIKDADKKVLYAGYNVRKHIPLKKDNFVSMVEFIMFQAFVARVKAAILIKSAEDKEAKAKHIAKFGDDETRKKVNKLAKMKEAIEALQKQLESDGVDLEDI